MHGIALLFRQQPSLSLPFQYHKNHNLKTFFARAGQTESFLHFTSTRHRRGGLTVRTSQLSPPLASVLSRRFLSHRGITSLQTPRLPTFRLRCSTAIFLNVAEDVLAHHSIGTKDMTESRHRNRSNFYTLSTLRRSGILMSALARTIPSQHMALFPAAPPCVLNKGDKKGFN